MLISSRYRESNYMQQKRNPGTHCLVQNMSRSADTRVEFVPVFFFLQFPLKVIN